MNSLGSGAGAADAGAADAGEGGFGWGFEGLLVGGEGSCLAGGSGLSFPGCEGCDSGCDRGDWGGGMGLQKEASFK